MIEPSVVQETPMLQLPDALHVGFSKCASTFLQTFFQQHPAIFLVNQSHFFSPFEYRKSDAGKEDYCALFRDARPGQVKIESDEHIVLPLFHPVLQAAATTLESVAEVSRQIRNIQPDGKIILVVRNQLDLIVSRYSEYVLGGGRCDPGVFVDEFLHCSTDGINYYQNYYSKIVEILHADFSPDNVLVLFQEELLRNEAKVIEHLCEFLGIETLQPRRRGIWARRVGLSSSGIRIVRKLNAAIVLEQEKSYNKARVRVPYALYKSCLGAIRLTDYYLPDRLKGNKNEILKPAMADRIRNEFREDNARLGSLLSKNISSWGY